MKSTLNIVKRHSFTQYEWRRTHPSRWRHYPVDGYKLNTRTKINAEARPIANTERPAPRVRRPGPVSKFSQRSVLEAAVRLIDRDGYREFSMRSLASEMKIGVMTLYGYFRTKEEILSGIGNLVLNKLGTQLDDSLPWHERIASILRDLHKVLYAHPGAMEMLLIEPVSAPSFDRARNMLLGILLEAGFTKTDTVAAVSSLTSFVVGLTVGQRSRRGRQLERGGSTEAKLRRAKEYPYLHKVAKEYKSLLSEHSFEYGLAHLLNGIRNDLERPPSAPPS